MRVDPPGQWFESMLGVIALLTGLGFGARISGLGGAPLGVHFDGIPPGLDSKRTEHWLAIQQRELELLREGRSVLDPYGAENAVEFFAVSVESFFERSEDVERHHPELYEMLSWYFGVDPVSWADGKKRYSVRTE